MRLVVLGLSLSSSWGNGHATTYRSLLKAFADRGHDILFLEREVPWYSGAARDMSDPGFCRLAFYDDLDGLQAYRDDIREAAAVIVGSYVPDGIAVGDFVNESARGVTAFYDIDTPVTLAALEAGRCTYLRADQIRHYGIYLSFTGGPVLDRLRDVYGAPCAAALYCCADPDLYRPGDVAKRWDLSYLGTYSDDRQPTLDRLLLDAARRAPRLRFVVAGSQYPGSIVWPTNVERIDHVDPRDHAAFYGASRFTLNVTRAEMIRAGHSPSVRLFEAAACGTPVISDIWPGLAALFSPHQSILLAEDAADVLNSLKLDDATARDIGAQARSCVLSAHTAADRAATLETLLSEALSASRDNDPAATIKR